jgi:hypothetical protein
MRTMGLSKKVNPCIARIAFVAVVTSAKATQAWPRSADMRHAEMSRMRPYCENKAYRFFFSADFFTFEFKLFK